MTDSNRRALVIGLDGLRPDLYDPDRMPSLSTFVETGVRFPDHHATYPTHTRVNISTLATGAYPGKHGLVANVFRLDGWDGPLGPIVDTSNDALLRALDQSPQGPALLEPTLGDILDSHGYRVAVSATSTAGAGILWTRNQPYRVVNVNSHYDRADLLSLREKLGPVPPVDGDHRLELQMYAARAVTDIFLEDDESRLIVLWLNEPDSSLHRYGLGSEEVDRAMEICDQVIGYVLDGLERSGVRDQFDVFVISDHGHSTVQHHRSLNEYLDRAYRDLGLPGQPPPVASDYVYLDDAARSNGAAEGIIRWIQEQPWAGAVLASGGLEQLPGVLPLSAMWGGATSDRSPSFAVTPAWSDEANERGVRGMVQALTEQVALRSSHGSASPFDTHAFLAASGPSFREGMTTTLPTGAVDLTPTLLQLLGIEGTGGHDGRVLWESLGSPAGEPGSHSTHRIAPEAHHPDGFEPEIVLESVGETRYVDRIENGRRTGS